MEPSSSSDPERWTNFYRATKDRPPRPLLIKALDYVQPPSDALDLGCGVLSDSVELLKRGFTVTAVDSSPQVEELARLLPKERFTCVISTFYDFDYGTYDLVSAQLSLPFNPPDTFTATFRKVMHAIQPGGIFTGQLFGVNDAWNTPESTLTFHTRSEAEQLLAEYTMEVLLFNEIEGMMPMACQGPKYTHAFEIIARKPQK